jgi:hypothetical protein
MNRHLLAVAALALLPAVTSAQNTAPVQIGVLSEVQLNRFGITDFGPVASQVARTYTIDPKAPTVTQRTAQFDASGAVGATIQVSWNATLNLCHETQTAVCLVFTPSISGGDSFTGQANSALLTSGSNVVLDGFGQFHFFLGGSVIVNENPTPGLYRGDFMLTAIYATL